MNPLLTSPALFVTGTDTEIGKTLVACALMHKLRELGRTVTPLKPVAAGYGSDGQNDDIRQLRAAASRSTPASEICPYLFEEAIAPHLAAQHRSEVIQLPRILEVYAHARQSADCVVIEGAGGLRVPFGTTPYWDTTDLIRALDCPVIVVVGMKLGCINHSILTLTALQQQEIPVAGWIANQIDPDMSCIEENLDTLKSCLAAPFLGHIPHLADGEDARQASKFLNF